MLYGDQQYHRLPEPAVLHLSDPRHLHFLAAFTEALDVPYRRGQTAIPIPEHAQHLNDWFLSEEYAALRSAASQRKGGAPSATGHNTASPEPGPQPAARKKPPPR